MRNEMRKLLFLLLGAVAFAVGEARAQTGNGAPSGKHWQFNIIGHPQNVDAIGGDDSNGRAIMVPLKNANGPGLPEIVCEQDGVHLTDDLEPTIKDQEPVGAKLYFEGGDHFEILDRDATDGNGARIMVPTTVDVTGETVLAVSVYIRVLGKPMQCMDIDGYAYDLDQNLWFWSGQVELRRKHGQSSFVPIDSLFDVFFCQIDPLTGECDPTTIDELSVFNNVFESYFWNILNDGTRLVQVRLYPITG